MVRIVVEGFHGTDVKNISQILESGFQSEVRQDHWLGQGIYFYDNHDLALWWIKAKLKTSTLQKCGVIKAILECEKQEFLDLDTIQGVDLFQIEVKRILKEELPDIQFTFGKSSTERIKNFCFALDLLKSLREIKLVAMTFLKDDPSYAAENVKKFDREVFTLPYSFTYRERQICTISNDHISSKDCVHPKNRTNWR